MRKKQMERDILEAAYTLGRMMPTDWHACRKSPDWINIKFD